VARSAAHFSAGSLLSDDRRCGRVITNQRLLTGLLCRRQGSDQSTSAAPWQQIRPSSPSRPSRRCSVKHFAVLAPPVSANRLRVAPATQGRDRSGFLAGVLPRRGSWGVTVSLPAASIGCGGMKEGQRVTDANPPSSSLPDRPPATADEADGGTGLDRRRGGPPPRVKLADPVMVSHARQSGCCSPRRKARPGGDATAEGLAASGDVWGMG